MFSDGDFIICKSVDDYIQQFGASSGKLSDLTIGDIYIIENVEVHGWHTEVSLKGVTGTFNSCLFEKE